VTQLHQAIDDKFRAAGIGIAFPQRDVHLRAAEPLEVRLSRAHAPASPAPAGRESANRSAQTDG
jgi:potassium efflux system protein